MILVVSDGSSILSGVSDAAVKGVAFSVSSSVSFSLEATQVRYLLLERTRMV